MEEIEVVIWQEGLSTVQWFSVISISSRRFCHCIILNGNEIFSDNLTPQAWWPFLWQINKTLFCQNVCESNQYLLGFNSILVLYCGFGKLGLWLEYLQVCVKVD